MMGHSESARWRTAKPLLEEWSEKVNRASTNSRKFWLGLIIFCIICWEIRILHLYWICPAVVAVASAEIVELARYVAIADANRFIAPKYFVKTIYRKRILILTICSSYHGKRQWQQYAFCSTRNFRSDFCIVVAHVETFNRNGKSFSRPTFFYMFICSVNKFLFQLLSTLRILYFLHLTSNQLIFLHLND